MTASFLSGKIISVYVLDSSSISLYLGADLALVYLSVL